MSKKHQSRPDGLMYSTNKDFFENYEAENNEQETIAKDKQKLAGAIGYKTTRRQGGLLQLVGFVGSDEDREALGKMLKTKCGAGGSVKEGLIMVQGDYKSKIIAWLLEWGYKNTK